MFTASMPNAGRLAIELENTGSKIAAVGRIATQTYGRSLRDAVRAHASGRPGPNIITGKYWESIKYRTKTTPVGFVAEVYSNAPQAYRLEYGFVGTDSLGRHYNQPPFPHFRPALQEISGQFHIGMTVAVGKALK
jgi:hypothetical protein